MKRKGSTLLRRKREGAPADGRDSAVKKPALGEEMEKGDTTAMLISAFLIFGGAIVAVLAVLTLIACLLFR